MAFDRDGPCAAAGRRGLWMRALSPAWSAIVARVTEGSLVGDEGLGRDWMGEDKMERAMGGEETMRWRWVEGRWVVEDG